MSSRGIAIQLNRLPEFVLRSWPIPIVIRSDQRQRDMRLSKAIIKLHRLHRRCSCVLPDLIRGVVSRLAQKVVGIREAGVRQGVVRIFFYSLIEINNCLTESFFRPLVPVEQALQIEAVSLWISGLGPG